jgi:tRNA 2-thiouridine synthesizing protein A
MAEVMLDARGLSCPLPILKARRALREMQAGQTVEVLSNDPAAPQNFREFCEASNHELLECNSVGGKYFRVVIKHGGGA